LDQEAAERTLVAVNNPLGGLELNELRLAMRMLPREQREALTLLGAMGLSYEEAAEICGTATGRIKSRVSRASAGLLLILQEGDLLLSQIDCGRVPELIEAATSVKASPQRCPLNNILAVSFLAGAKRRSTRCRGMRYFVIARSRHGWGVALDSDLLAEFPDLGDAQAHATSLRETATFRDPDFDVLDLSEAESDSVLMAEDSGSPH
jgi:hypothetical protein